MHNYLCISPVLHLFWYFVHLHVQFDVVPLPAELYLLRTVRFNDTTNL